jgi:hypothetical protein
MHKALPRKRSEPGMMPHNHAQLERFSMIVASSRRYLPNSGHDHGRHPKLAMIRSLFGRSGRWQAVGLRE